MAGNQRQSGRQVKDVCVVPAQAHRCQLKNQKPLEAFGNRSLFGRLFNSRSFYCLYKPAYRIARICNSSLMLTRLGGLESRKCVLFPRGRETISSVALYYFNSPPLQAYLTLLSIYWPKEEISNNIMGNARNTQRAIRINRVDYRNRTL